MKPLVLVLKHLLYKLGLDQPYNGTMGSYMVSTLVIIYLQLYKQHEALMSCCPAPADTPHPAIAHHLINFLHFYTHFPTDQYGFTINSTDLTVSIVARPDLHAASSLLADNEQFKRLMYVQDPIDAQNNVARSCYKLAKVKGAFKVMLSKLEQSCPPRCTWMQTLMHISVQDIDKCDAATPNKRSKLNVETASQPSTRETLQSLTVNVEQPAVLPVDASPPPLEPASPVAKPAPPAVQHTATPILQQSEDQLRSVAQSMAQSLTSVFRSEADTPSRTPTKPPASNDHGSNSPPTIRRYTVPLGLGEIKLMTAAEVQHYKADIIECYYKRKEKKKAMTDEQKRQRALRRYKGLLLRVRSKEAKRAARRQQQSSQSAQQGSSEIIDLFEVSSSDDDEDDNETHVNDEKGGAQQLTPDYRASRLHGEPQLQQDDEKREAASHDAINQGYKQYTAKRLRKLSVLEFEQQAEQILLYLQAQHGKAALGAFGGDLDGLPPQQQLKQLHIKRKSSKGSARQRKALKKQVQEMATTELRTKLAELTSQLTRLDTRYTPLSMVDRHKQQKQQAINLGVSNDVEKSIVKQLDKRERAANQSLPPMLGDQRLTLAVMQRFSHHALQQHRKKVMKALRALNMKNLKSVVLEASVQRQYRELLERAQTNNGAATGSDEQKADLTTSSPAAHSDAVAEAHRERLTLDVIQQMSCQALTKNRRKVRAALLTFDVEQTAVSKLKERQSRVDRQYNQLYDRAHLRSTNGGLESSDDEEFIDEHDADKSDTDDDVQELELKTGEIAKMISDTRPIKRRLRSNCSL